VVVHVQGEDTIPAFSDQPQYEAAAYATEFLARHVPGAPEARAQLRYGDPVDQILAAIAEERAELLAVGWTQGARPDRGLVARALAVRCPVPVLLVPLASPPA
jgi:nucleotide-binding universal stress UspA family protein